MTKTLAAKCNEALDAGMLVQIATYLRVTRVTTKTRDSWRKAGFEFFKADAEGQTYMIEGQSKGRPRYVRLTNSGCKVQAFAR